MTGKDFTEYWKGADCVIFPDLFPV
jgi:hypothetical protein